MGFYYSIIFFSKNGFGFIYVIENEYLNIINMELFNYYSILNANATLLIF